MYFSIALSQIFWLIYALIALYTLDPQRGTKQGHASQPHLLAAMVAAFCTGS